MGTSVRLRGIFAAVEAVYGTAETLVGADAIQVMNLQPLPTENLRMLEREIIRSSLQPEQAIYGGSLFGFTFDVELKGSGTAGTAPRLGVLLRACGMDETIVASTSVTYTPSSDLSTHESVTIGLREGGNWRVIAGCRGNVSMNLAAGAYGVLSFRFVGHIDSEAAAAAPTASFETTVPPAFLSATFQIGGYASPIESLTLDLANTLAISPDPNAADGYGDIRVTARNTVGTVNPEHEDIGTKDFIGELRAGTTQAIQTGVIGSAGNQWAVSIPNSYWRELGFGDRESLLTFDGSFGAVESTLDDEMSLQFT